MTIGKHIRFAAPLLLFAVSFVSAQSTSEGAVAAPFKVEQGMFFSASVGKPADVSPRKSLNKETVKITSDFQDAMDVIRNQHVDGSRLAFDALTKSSISSLLRTLDPHSNYFDADEFRELLGEQE